MIKRISILLLCLSCVAQADNLTKYYRLLEKRSVTPDEWTPASFGADLIGWWEAQSTNNMTIEYLGGATNPVRAWTDLSDANRIALAPSSSPWWRTNAINGHPAIEWKSGRNSALVFTNALPTTNTTHVAVFRRSATANNIIIFGSTSARPMPIRWNTSSVLYSMPTTGDPFAQTTNTATGNFWITQQFDGTNASLRLNGTNLVLGVSSSVSTFAAANGIGQGGTTLHDDYIGECFVVKRVLTAEEITEIDNYIKTKWGF